MRLCVMQKKKPFLKTQDKPNKKSAAHKQFQKIHVG